MGVGPQQPRPVSEPSRWVLIGDVAAVIARRKVYVLHRITPPQAVVVMDAMNYDVHLFTDAATGEDAMVYRAGPAALRLARQCSRRQPAVAPPLRLAVHPPHTPILAEADAVHRLCDDGLPFVFFTEQATGRGRLLYRRYQGNLGVINPIGDISQDGA